MGGDRQRPLRMLKGRSQAQAMMCPPSLPNEVRARAFCATNGELGVLPADALSFLDACRADGVKVLGWELWVANHRWDPKSKCLVSATGQWDGGVPMRAHDVPALVGGEGDVDAVARQLASLSFEDEVQVAWLPHIRVNFTLGD